MFILKLGAEALSLKSESLENKYKENLIISISDTSSSSSTLSETNGRMLENLLSGGEVESALLAEESQIKRCKSVTNSSKSAFLQNNAHRPRSDTAPQSSLYVDNRQHVLNNQFRKRKSYENNDDLLTKSILFESLSNPVKSRKRALLPPAVSTINNFNLASEFLISETQSSYSTLSIDEMKLLREQTNGLLKKIMHIIKSYSNYSSVTESRRFSFVSNLWYKIIVLAILQMDTESCRFMFRWLLLSIFNGKDDVDCSRRDKILLLEKLQEYVKNYFWLKTNSELLHCVLFWFFSKYGYPDVFFMSPQAVMCKLNDLVIDKGQLDSILKLIHELSDITESHMCQLFCQHLPTASSMAEFLIQWT